MIEPQIKLTGGTTLGEALLVALFTVVAEKGIESLGKELKRATLKLWKRLRKNGVDIPDLEKCNAANARSVAAAIEVAALADGALAKEVTQWSKKAESLGASSHTHLSPQHNIAKGLFIASNISQSNSIS